MALLKGESRITAIVKNGNITIVNDKISIQKADEVTLYLTAGTNFLMILMSVEIQQRLIKWRWKV